MLPNWLCFSSGVILEIRSAALSLKEDDSDFCFHFIGIKELDFRALKLRIN